MRPVLSHRPADAARRPSELLTVADAACPKSPRPHLGLDSPGESPSSRRHPSGVEHTALHCRSVGTERFLRRGPWRAAVVVPNGDGGRTSKSGLVLLGAAETDADARTIPVLREVGVLAYRGCPTVTMRRRRPRRARNRCLYSCGLGHRAVRRRCCLELTRSPARSPCPIPGTHRFYAGVCLYARNMFIHRGSGAKSGRLRLLARLAPDKVCCLPSTSEARRR